MDLRGLFSRVALPHFSVQRKGAGPMNEIVNEIVCSCHGRTRAQQRGVTLAQIDAIVRYADREVNRGSGCTWIWISRKTLRRLGASTPEGVSTDRLQGLMLLQSDDQACVTVFRNRRSNGYRRNSGRG